MLNEVIESVAERDDVQWLSVRLPARVIDNSTRHHA